MPDYGRKVERLPRRNSSLWEAFRNTGRRARLQCRPRCDTGMPEMNDENVATYGGLDTFFVYNQICALLHANSIHEATATSK